MDRAVAALVGVLKTIDTGSSILAAPMTYRVKGVQYVAVQTSGRHLHPVKYDKLENSSYIFVFAVN